MDYRYLACDLLTDEPIAWLDMVSVSYSTVLTGWGELEGTVKLPSMMGTPDDRAKATAVLRAVLRGTDIARTALYVVRGGAIVWGGIVWEDDYESGSGTVSIKATEFFAGFDRQIMCWAGSYQNVDQFSILRDVLAVAQSDPAANLRVVPSTHMSGVSRVRRYYAYERKSVAETLLQLSAVIGGFEWRHQVDTTSGARVRRLVLGHPSVGQDRTADAVFAYPGNVISYRVQRSGDRMANRVWGIGSGEGPTQLVERVSDPQTWAEGYPLLDGEVSRTTVTERTTLYGHAAAALAQRSRPVAYPQLVVRSDMHPTFGSYAVGDLVRVRIDDPYRFPDGWPDAALRVLQIRVAVGDTGGEAVQLTLGGAPVPAPANPSDPDETPPVAPEPPEPVAPEPPPPPPTPPPVPYPGQVLSWRGRDRGPEVRRAQTKVNAMGYTPALVVDGVYGRLTDAGVRWAQTQLRAAGHNLGPYGVDGCVGPYTWKAMFG